MSDSLYERALEQRFTSAVQKCPSIAVTTVEVFERLKARNGYYEQGLVDAIFQKWDRFPLTILDAFGFLDVYSRIVTGDLRVARIHVGETPSRDSAVEENNAKLKRLAPQFSADFHGGKGDHDGLFTWHDHLHVGGYINVDGRLVDGPEFAIHASSLPLEVGTQAGAKTLHMVAMWTMGIARWPYDSEDIWVIAKPFGLVEASCVRDDDGWPCSRVRVRPDVSVESHLQ